MDGTQTIGAKIVSLRKEKGCTQADLGAYLNISYQAVSKWERDESCPDFATMSKLAKYFGVPISYFEGKEEHSSNSTAESEEIMEEEVGGIVCPFCGKKTLEMERFCVHCDGFLGKEVVNKPKTQSKQIPKKLEFERFKYCGACGNRMPLDAFWCPDCHSIAGTKETAKGSYTGERNGWAIAAISCVGFMGFIFAIIGLFRSRVTGTGKVLSTVALILSVVWILICCIVWSALLNETGNSYYY